MAGLFTLGVIAYKDMADIAAKNLPRAQFYTEEFKSVLMNMNGVTFAKLSLTDFIYKNNLPFFLIFVVIHTVNTFSSDRENGTMKFTLLTGVDKETLIAGKLMFMASSIGMIVLLNILLSLAIGCFFFGGTGDFIQIIEYIGISLLAILPGLSMAVIVAVLSQIRISSKIIMAIGLITVLVLGMLDTMTATNRFRRLGSFDLCRSNSELQSGIAVALPVPRVLHCWFILLGITKNYNSTSKGEFTHIRPAQNDRGLLRSSGLRPLGLSHHIKRYPGQPLFI